MPCHSCDAQCHKGLVRCLCCALMLTSSVCLFVRVSCGLVRLQDARDQGQVSPSPPRPSPARLPWPTQQLT